jgi:hypothetical protein
MRSLENLLESLANATEQDKLSWRNDSTDTYVASLPNDYVVYVWQWFDEDSGTTGITAKLEQRGQLLDKVMADEFRSSFSALSRLYDSARRSANNIDAVIDDVEKVLSSLKRAK